MKTFLHWLQVVISNMILDHVTKMPIQYSYKRTNGISEITEIPPPPRIEKTNQRLHYTHQHHTPIILFASVHQHSWFMTFCDLKNLTLFFFFSHNKQKGSSIYRQGPSTHFLYSILTLCDNKYLKFFYNKQKRSSIYRQEPSTHFFYSIFTFHFLVAPLGIGFTQDSCSSNEQTQSSILNF